MLIALFAPPLAEVVPQQVAAQPRLLAVEVVRQQGAAQPQLPAEVAHQRAVVVLVRPQPEAAVVSPLRAVAVRKQVVAATRTEMPGIEETSKSMSAVLPLAGDTTAACGTGRGGTSGAGNGTSTALAVAGLKPRSVSYGFVAERSLFSGSVIACASADLDGSLSARLDASLVLRCSVDTAREAAVERVGAHFAFQCGYCTPGFVNAAQLLAESLAREPIPKAEVETRT